MVFRLCRGVEWLAVLCQVIEDFKFCNKIRVAFRIFGVVRVILSIYCEPKMASRSCVRVAFDPVVDSGCLQVCERFMMVYRLSGMRI